ncbi:MAG: hydroxypyruvate isomerase family protein [Reyranellaceae bacterium]
MRFAANLSFLFPEFEFLERFAAAREAGFAAVEFFFPEEVELGALVQAKEETGLDIALMNLPMGDRAAGDRGLACLPDRVPEFRRAVDRGITLARALRCPRLHAVAGVVPRGSDRARYLDTLVDNLQYAADRAAAHGIAITLEPINSRDIPGFIVNRSSEAIEILDRADRPNLLLQYDLYHAQVMEGDLIPTIERLFHRIGHMQFADTPGRHEPGTGEINFATVFSAIERLGYGGYIAAEYRPSTARTEDSLAWFQPYRARQ